MNKFFFLFFCWLYACVSYAQTMGVKTDISGLEPELVYLQTDKGVYETGEDLWFKSYTMDAQSLALSDRSKTLFVEMFNEKDSVVWQEKYPIFSGIAEGHIYVDKELTAGDYRIHAYTRLSFMNDTMRPFYPKKISVVKDIVNRMAKRPQKKGRTDIRLSFFPEGGNLIDGLTAKVAFNARDGKGMPVHVKGVLLENDEEVARVETLHDGMGYFFILPRKEASYKVVLDDGREFPFTEVYDSGLSIHLRKQTDDYLEFHLSQPKGTAAQTVRVEGKMRGMLCCSATGVLRDRLKVRMPLAEFPMQGIAEITLYNAEGQAMAERLVYVHPERRLHIELKTDSERYYTRGKGKLNIKVTDEAGKPVQAHLGLSLFDRIYRDELNPENMLSYCSLTTEIKGHIHNPAYYFDEDNKDRLLALDLLLLTQGWRRYVWVKADSRSEADAFLSDEIKGRLIVSKRNKLKELGSGEQLIQVSGPDTENCFIDSKNKETSVVKTTFKSTADFRSGVYDTLPIYIFYPEEGDGKERAKGIYKVVEG